VFSRSNGIFHWPNGFFLKNRKKNPDFFFGFFLKKNPKKNLNFFLSKNLRKKSQFFRFFQKIWIWTKPVKNCFYLNQTRKNIYIGINYHNFVNLRRTASYNHFFGRPEHTTWDADIIEKNKRKKTTLEHICFTSLLL